MGLGIVEIIILLVVCALVIAALRNPSWKTLVALPLGILLLLGTATIVWSLAAYRVHDVPNARVEMQNLRLEQHPSSWRDHFVSEAGAGVSSPVPGPKGLKMLFLIVPVMLAVALFVTIPILGRKWISEHRAIVIPAVCILGVAFVALSAVGSVGVYVARASVVSADDVRRTEIASRLREIGESLHQKSAREKTVPVVAVQPAASESDENSESAAEAAAAASGSSDIGTTAETPVAANTPAAATAEATPPPAALPDWIRGHELEINDVTRTPILLASEQWSSVPESEVQIEQLAEVAILQQLQLQRPDLDGWRPNNDFIHQSGAIRQRFVEQTSLKVGEVEMPMYRSYWQLAVTPQVNDMAYQEWKATAIERRILWLGGGAGGLTLLFGAIAAALRIDASRSSRYRGRTVAAAVGIVAMLGAAAALAIA